MGKIVIVSVLVFLIVVLLLVSILLFARKKLVPQGKVKININDKKELEVESGSSILATLAAEKVFLPSACGGQGTCGMCKCKVLEGGGEMLPTEKPHFSRKQQQEHYRLGCQVKVKENMKIQIPEEIFGIKKWECFGLSFACVVNHFVVTLEFAVEHCEVVVEVCGDVGAFAVVHYFC